MAERGRPFQPGNQAARGNFGPRPKLNKPYTDAVRQLLECPVGERPEGWPKDRKLWTHAQELAEIHMSMALAGSDEAKGLIERAEGKTPMAPEDRAVAEGEAAANMLAGFSAVQALQIALGLKPQNVIDTTVVEDGDAEPD